MSHEGREDGDGVDTLSSVRRQKEGRRWEEGRGEFGGWMPRLSSIFFTLDGGETPKDGCTMEDDLGGVDPMAGVPWWYSRRPGLTQDEEEDRSLVVVVVVGTMALFRGRGGCHRTQPTRRRNSHLVECEFLRGSTEQNMPLGSRKIVTHTHTTCAGEEDTPPPSMSCLAVQLSKCSSDGGGGVRLDVGGVAAAAR